MLRAVLAALVLLAGVQVAMASQPAKIKLDPHRTRWTVEATVGGIKGRFLLDTGGGLTLMSRELVEAAGCQPWGRMTGFNMFGKRGDTPRCEGVSLTINGQTFTPAVVGLINMGKLNPNDADIAGIVSLDLFDGQAITLDLAHGELTLETPASLAVRTAEMTPVPVRLVREVQGLALAAMVGVKAGPGNLWLELDSGNGGTILVSKPVAPLLGLNPDMEGKQPLRFTVADTIVVDSQDAFTPDLIYDGNLGMPFLKTTLVTLDLKEGRCWMKAAP